MLQRFTETIIYCAYDHIFLSMYLITLSKKKNQTGKKETKSKTIQLGWFINMDVLAKELISWFKYLELP